MRRVQFAGAILVLAVGVTLLPSNSEAVTSCKVRVSSKTGLIDVSAREVSGPLLWGDRSGSESTTFLNAATCIAGGSASKCEFGAPGTAQAITPPDLCTVYLKDSGPECAAFIKGCTPGPRFTDQAKADDLKELVGAVSFHHSVPTMVFTGVNVQIVSGSGATDGPVNGTGNLIIGYNATASSVTQSGSHNLVVGDGHTFASYGGLVAGQSNSITAPWASVSGGNFNSASGTSAAVSGGQDNTASATYAAVSGGSGNRASGPRTSVSGGSGNQATGDSASVSGGELNVASNFISSVSGGSGNVASGDVASVSGGSGNVASGPAASVSGGEFNAASGVAASVSGGEGITQPIDMGWAAGTQATSCGILGTFDVCNFESP